MMINMQRFRLLGILLFHIQGAGMQVLLNPLEILVKEFFFLIKRQPYSLQMQKKRSFSQIVFKDF